MASLIDKIRSMLGHRASQTRGDLRDLRYRRSEEGAPPLAGKPTIGSSLGMRVEGTPPGVRRTPPQRQPPTLIKNQDRRD
jgi:hypothetical protein